jgi:phosphate-selective porin OprO/OprP
LPACLIALLLLAATVAAAEEPAATAPRSALRFNIGWPEGITYEFRKVTPSLGDQRLLSPLENVYLIGRVGARLDIDAAAFAVHSLPDFDNGIAARRVRFYLLGDFSLGLPLGYKFEFSIEGRKAFLNDFYIRWRPPRWVDSVDVGYLTPPMGLENVVSSRTLTFMEVAGPVQALAPGFRSGIAAAGHSDPWRTAWKLGFYSVGQQQLVGDASQVAAQFVGRLAWLPWPAPPDSGTPLVHLGGSMSYVVPSDDTIQYRARPESFIAPYIVNTGDIPADNAFQVALEGACSDGPFLLSGEFLSSQVDAKDGHDQIFYGMYGLFSWLLTGEHHPYNTATGLFERPQPDRPFSFRRRQWGALEVGQRLSWLDLNDTNVHGGKMLTLTTGLTWYLNAELKFFANYIFAHVVDGAEEGDANVFQIRIEVGI